MPNIKSAKKRVLLNKKNNLRNRSVKSNVKTRIKKFLLLAEKKDINQTQAKKIFIDAIKSIDQAASKKIYHKNTAARKKSRLAKLFNKLSA
ncbi:MAG: 30S ribosomal protein S20 [Firmicutes bacterium]|nr:30S ribosomal protein S20 [Bacillota bacterium]